LQPSKKKHAREQLWLDANNQYKEQTIFNKNTCNLLFCSVKPDDLSWVLCTGLRHGSEDDWELAWDRVQKTGVLLERQALLKALGCTSNRKLLLRYLDRSIDPKTLIK